MDVLRQIWEYQILEINGFTLELSSVVLSLLIFLLTWLASRQIYRLLNNPRFLTSIPKDDIRRKSIVRTSRYILWPLGIILAVVNLGIDLKELLDTQIISFGDEKEVRVVNLVIIILIIILTRISVYYIHLAINRLGKSKRIPMDEGRRKAIYQIFRYMVYLIAVLFILTNLDVNLRGLLLGSAALFVGVGLALQQTFADIASGILILFDGTVEVGDVVYVNSLDLEGEVKEIRLRTSIVETLDSVSVIVPNSKLTSTNVVNWKFNDQETRFRVNVGVAYGSNVQLVRKVLISCAESHGLILKHPPPRVRFVDFGNSSLDFELLFWTHKMQEHEDIKSDLRFMIDANFRKQEIEIPFPQRDLHIRSDYRHHGTETAVENLEKKEEDKSPQDKEL